MIIFVYISGVNTRTKMYKNVNNLRVNLRLILLIFTHLVGKCVSNPNGNCIDGTYNNNGDCILCPSGSSGQGCVCEAGFENRMKEQFPPDCIACERGFFFEDISKTCKPCRPGFYSNRQAQTQCTPCSSDLVSPVYASTLCTPCPLGFEANDGSTHCFLKSAFSEQSEQTDIWKLNIICSNNTKLLINDVKYNNSITSFDDTTELEKYIMGTDMNDFKDLIQLTTQAIHNQDTYNILLLLKNISSIVPGLLQTQQYHTDGDLMTFNSCISDEREGDCMGWLEKYRAIETCLGQVFLSPDRDCTEQRIYGHVYMCKQEYTNTKDCTKRIDTELHNHIKEKNITKIHTHEPCKTEPCVICSGCTCDTNGVYVNADPNGNLCSLEVITKFKVQMHAQQDMLLENYTTVRGKRRISTLNGGINYGDTWISRGNDDLYMSFTPTTTGEHIKFKYLHEFTVRLSKGYNEFYSYLDDITIHCDGCSTVSTQKDNVYTIILTSDSVLEYKVSGTVKTLPMDVQYSTGYNQLVIPYTKDIEMSFLEVLGFPDGAFIVGNNEIAFYNENTNKWTGTLQTLKSAIPYKLHVASRTLIRYAYDQISVFGG